MHLSTPVVGDEQVFDVELDRNTELFTNREERRSISWDIADNDHPISGDSNSLRNGVDDERTEDGDQKEAEAGPFHFYNFSLSCAFAHNGSYLLFVTSNSTMPLYSML